MPYNPEAEETRYSRFLIRMVQARRMADQLKESTIERESASTMFDPNEINVPWRKLAIDARTEFCENAGERAWEAKYRDVISVFGLTMRGIARNLGEHGKEAVNQNEEGLTTFREFINWLEVEIGQKSMVELGFHRS